MPTLMSMGKEAEHEFISARDVLLEPVLPDVTCSFGKVERCPAEMSDPMWSPYKGYGAYELLYDASHGRVVAPEGAKDERAEDGSPVVELTAGRLFGASVVDVLASKSVEAVNKLVRAQADSPANLLPMPKQLAENDKGLAGALDDIRLYYICDGKCDGGCDVGQMPFDANGDVAKWLDTFGHGHDGWDVFCRENFISYGSCALEVVSQDYVLFAWQKRADDIVERIKEKVLAVREDYVRAGRPEGEYVPFTALTDLIIGNDGGWCHVELLDALVGAVGADAAIRVLMESPRDFATMSDEYLELAKHGIDVSLEFADADDVTTMSVNVRIEKAKDDDWRFDVELVRAGGDSFWLWRLTGEHGDLQNVVEEYTRTGLYFPYNDEFDHSHSFNGVLQSIWYDPEGFVVSDEQKGYYSEQELEMMDAFRTKLLARKAGEPDGTAFAWQVREDAVATDGDDDASDDEGGGE